MRPEHQHSGLRVQVRRDLLALQAALIDAFEQRTLALKTGVGSRQAARDLRVGGGTISSQSRCPRSLVTPQSSSNVVIVGLAPAEPA